MAQMAQMDTDKKKRWTGETSPMTSSGHLCHLRMILPLPPKLLRLRLTAPASMDFLNSVRSIDDDSIKH
jgi:hypothetical protein